MYGLSWLYSDLQITVSLSTDCRVILSTFFYVYEMFMYLYAPCQLQRVRGNTDRDTTCRVSYDSCLQRIHAKQSLHTLYGSTTRQWRCRQWAWRLNNHLQMVHIVSGYTAKFIIWSHLLYPNEANKPEYWQLYTFDFSESTTELIENK
jgi:hypothetical protein